MKCEICQNDFEPNKYCPQQKYCKRACACEAWKRRHPEQDAACRAEYRRVHRTELCDKHRKYYKDCYKEIRVRAAKAARAPRPRFQKARACAKRRGISFDLTFDQYLVFVANGYCHYCHGELPAVGGGLDRKNSQLGYSLTNCVACCSDCNNIRGKDVVSYEEMRVLAQVLCRLRGGHRWSLSQNGWESQETAS